MQIAAFIDTVRIICDRFYVTVQRPSVCSSLRPSVRLPVPSIDRCTARGGFAAVRPAGRRYRSTAPGAAARRTAARGSAANVSSVTLSVDAGS